MHGFVSLLAGALHTLGGASLLALALAMALHLGKVAAEARSWHAIVQFAHPASRIRFGTSLAAFAGAIGANAILPARVGDALRLGIVRRRAPDSTVATIAGTIVLETVIEIVFGGAVVLFVLLAGRSVGGGGSPSAAALAHPAVVGVVVGVAALLATVGWMQRERLVRIARSMAQGMSIIGSPGPLLRGVMLWKLVAWSLRFAAVYCFLVAFHLGGGLWAVLLVVAAQNVAGLLPLAPGSAGAQQAALAVALAGTVGIGTIIGFGVGMQVATALADVAIGLVAVGLVSSRADLAEALRRRPRAAAPAFVAR